MTRHHRTVCRSCGSTVSQCRCSSKDKEIRFVESCRLCQGPACDATPNAVKCPACGFWSLAAANFCGACGFRIAREIGQVRIVQDASAKPGEVRILKR